MEPKGILLASSLVYFNSRARLSWKLKMTSLSLLLSGLVGQIVFVLQLYMRLSVQMNIHA